MIKKYDFRKVLKYYTLRKKLCGEYPGDILSEEKYFDDIENALLSRTGEATSDSNDLFLDFIHILVRAHYIVKKKYAELFTLLYERNKLNKDKEIIYEIIECIGDLCGFNNISEPKFEIVLKDALERYADDTNLTYITLHSIWMTRIAGAYNILKKYQFSKDPEIRGLVIKAIQKIKSQKENANCNTHNDIEVYKIKGKYATELPSKDPQTGKDYKYPKEPRRIKIK